MQKVRIALRWLHRQIPKASRKCCGLWASLGGRYFTDSEFESFKSFLLSDAPLSKVVSRISFAFQEAPGPSRMLALPGSTQVWIFRLWRKEQKSTENPTIGQGIISWCLLQSIHVNFWMRYHVYHYPGAEIPSGFKVTYFGAEYLRIFSLEPCVCQVHFMIWRLARSQEFHQENPVAVPDDVSSQASDESSLGIALDEARRLVHILATASCYSMLTAC